MNKKLLSFLLTVLMSMVGTKAFAHDIEVPNSDGVTIYYVWRNNNTELAVSYKGTSSSSYTEYSGNVVIPESVIYEEKNYNVTSIENNAFAFCSDLTSIEIPNCVTRIGEYSFEDCSGLKSITIPYNVTSIGQYAFYGCSGLASITIPYNVTSIGQYAFYGCSGIKSLTILSITTNYGTNAFGECKSLREVTFDCETVTSVFRYWTSINKVNFTNNVTQIADGAFMNCSGLTSITIPSSITSIGSSAFAYCSGLTSVTIFGCPSLAYGVFYNCNNIKEATFDCETVTSFFSSISSLEKVSLSNNVICIGDYAFSNCSGLTSVEIPNSVKSIGNSAFNGCSGLTSIEIPNSVESIGNSAFNGCSGLTNITIGNNVNSIGESAFSGCSGLKSIKIPNSVTSIGNSAFEKCIGLYSIIISNSVNTIGNMTFRYCSNLTSLVVGSAVSSIGNNAFTGTNLKKTIWLTNTPPSGYKYAAGEINYVSNNKYTSLSNTVIYPFLSSFFDVDGIRYVPVSPSDKTCDAIDCIYDESSTNTQIASTVDYKGVSMNVKKIQPYLAYNNKNIKSISIDTEGELADYSFTNCSNLETVIYGEKIKDLGLQVFCGCSSLTTLTPSDNQTQSKVICISKNIANIRNNAFDGCTGIKNINIMDSENDLNLGSNGSNPIFYSCPLDYVYIGRNINYNKTSSYGYSPFYRNTSLSAVEITDKETEISDNEFYGCTNLQRVKIGDGITTIGNWAFSGCQNLQYFAFGSQVNSIGQEAFSDCSAVTEIISKTATPPVCGTQALDDINKWDCKLYVPDGYMAAYEAADQWKDFLFKEEGEGTATQNPEGQPETGKCEKPTISIVDGKIHFTCATDGVCYTYYVTATNPSGVGNDINPSSLTLTVYASKPGFETSDAATIEFAAPNGLKGDLNNDGIVNVADHVELSNIILK